MSGQANPQHEPTMEEILASIRKIISEDQPAEPSKPAAKSAQVKLQAVPDPAPAAAVEDPDILDLTEEVQDDDNVEVLKPLAAAPVPAAPAVASAPAIEPVRAVAAPAAPPIENDIAFETIDPVPKPAEGPMDHELISDSTRNAVGRAFANLNGDSPQFTPKAGSIEALFVNAVQDSFKATLQEWIDAHSDEIMESLKPLIRSWMDEHLPPLVQATVVKEIARAAEQSRKR